ncbi:NUMOD4 motif-containing HNH endonuclease [Sphingobacterium lactis]|uniref:NUMOD4 motif-containing HNH endonuclease n=1 Tax=Sphingobacterium lactis TaxID=797291 RepID=UPI003EC70012
MTEIWKPIERLNNLYEISNFGNVRSVPRVIINKKKNGRKPSIYTQKQKIIKTHDNGNGYKYFSVSINSKKTNTYVHRAIANAFLPNPFNLGYVNHIDGNKSNNSIANLEWVTQSENNKHAFKIGLKDRNKSAVAKKVLDTETGKIFGTIKEASEFFGVKYGLLKEALKRNSIHKNPIYKRLQIFQS